MSTMDQIPEAPLYAGRFVHRRGARGTIDVLAAKTQSGWEVVVNPRNLFPRAGQVEVHGVPVVTLRPGDWIAFQVLPRTKPRTPATVGEHRLLPRYVDMNDLGSIEAARTRLSTDGWVGGHRPGHWAVRVTVDRILVLDLKRDGTDKLRVAGSNLQNVPSYAFDATCIMSEPGIGEQASLYDLGNAEPLATFDWSPDADYVAHIIRSLAGYNDPRLDEIIIWLELHRDESTGMLSATGADAEKGFEALRSGELAKRLSTDKILMNAYLSAVRDDPTIAKLVINAAAQSVSLDQARLAAELRLQLEAAHQEEERRQDEQLVKREHELTEALLVRVEAKNQTLERDLKHREEAAVRAIEERVSVRENSLLSDLDMLEARREALLADQRSLETKISHLEQEIAGLDSDRRLANEALAKLSVASDALAGRSEAPARVLIRLPAARGSALPVNRLPEAIARTALLTSAGKILMERFCAFILAGELPILEGDQVDDFALVAEALLAAGRLIPFDADATILTPEDVWSRPGSGMASPVSQAFACSQGGGGNFLISLRGLERSAARAWYPALAALNRRGLLPRRLMIFATVLDESSAELKALPTDVCRLKISGAIATGAHLIAPTLLGSDASAIAYQLDPGERETNLSSTLPILSRLESPIDVARSLRVARVAHEALRIRPGDEATALNVAREFCAAIATDQPSNQAPRQERRHA